MDQGRHEDEHRAANQQIRLSATNERQNAVEDEGDEQNLDGSAQFELF